MHAIGRLRLAMQTPASVMGGEATVLSMEDIRDVMAGVDKAYAILRAGDPPFSAREANAARALWLIGGRLERR